MSIANLIRKQTEIGLYSGKDAETIRDISEQLGYSLQRTREVVNTFVHNGVLERVYIRVPGCRVPVPAYIKVKKPKRGKK